MADKALKIGTDYGSIFGIPEGKGSAIYNGGISWTVTGDRGTATMDSQPTTDKATAYINQPSYKVGA
jgi:hypothetical protein